MNAAAGGGKRNISNNLASDIHPDWGTAEVTEPPPEEDTTPPSLTVPNDIIVEATSEQGAQVKYKVTAQDNVDGSATLEEYGSTITQDDVGGDINISCEPASGSVFPIGETEVECSATDAAGNTATASFTVTVPHPSCRGQDATIVGTAGNDDLVGTSNRDVIAALGGNDKISGLGGNDLTCGGNGSDTMAGGAGNDIMTGQSGNDQMAGGTGNDQLLGEEGNDSIVGGEGTDSANGGTGTNDTCTAETETNCEA
jgi:Ca2+-binding RTX toxin-like protein